MPRPEQAEGRTVRILVTGTTQHDESEARTIFLIPASVAATVASTAARAPIRRRLAAGSPSVSSLERRACLVDAGLSARGCRTSNTAARQRIYLSSVTRWPTSFLQAMINDLTAWARSNFTWTE